MSQKKIFLIRHGQTTSNVKRKALGQSDIELTDEGVEEIEKLGAHLKENGVHPDKIYTSPLKRAKKTAELLQRILSGIIKENKALKEIDYGTYEGIERQRLRKIEYGYNSQRMREAMGETVEEVERRVMPFLTHVLRVNDNSILIITHAFIASVLTQIIMNIPRTFPNIQPLSTADYNYFRVEKGGENTVNVLTSQRNCLKGALSI